MKESKSKVSLLLIIIFSAITFFSLASADHHGHEYDDQSQAIKLIGGPFLANEIVCMFRNTTDHDVPITVSLYYHEDGFTQVVTTSSYILEAGEVTSTGTGWLGSIWGCDITYSGRLGDIVGSICDYDLYENCRVLQGFVQ